MLVILIVLIGLSLLILGHEAGHFFAAKFFKLKVDEFGFGFPPRAFAWRPFDAAQGKGETEYSVNWLPFGGFVKIAGENDRLNGDLNKLDALPELGKKRLFLFQPAWKRSVIILAGVLMNFLIGWFLISTVFMIGTDPALIIAGIQPDSPAAHIGLREGDLVTQFGRAEAFIQFVNEHRGREIVVEVKRAGENLTFSVTPRVEAKPGEGALGVFLTDAGIPRYGFFRAMGEGLERSLEVVQATFVAFYHLIASLFFNGTLLAGVVGPVGIFSVATEVGKTGLLYLFQLIALISLNLAVINLMPFPALDGGRFFLILIEKIKGSPVPRKLEMFVNGLGFIFLLILIALITARDIAQLF